MPVAGAEIVPGPVACAERADSRITRKVVKVQGVTILQYSFRELKIFKTLFTVLPRHCKTLIYEFIPNSSTPGTPDR